MPTCRAKTEGDHPCPQVASDSTGYCQEHDPYKRLAQASRGEEKTNIVLQLMDEHPERRLVLPGRADLRCVKLEGIDLKDAALQNANLKYSNLQRVDLSYASLQGADLESAKLQDASLIHANLEAAHLHNANLSGAHLGDTNFRRAVLTDASLQGANLSDADFRAASLRNADLQNAVLGNANFMGANLGQTNLYGADLTGNADLRNVSLRFASLQGALTGAVKLDGANLRKSRLQRVDLSLATIAHIHICGAWLDKTKLQREQLGGAIGEELAGDYEKAKQGYLALKQNFDDLGDYDAASWAYRKERRMEKLEAAHNGKDAIIKRRWWLAICYGVKVAGDQFVELLCDYGESVRRVLFWMLALLFVIGPALLGLLGGLEWTDNPRDTYFNLPTLWQRRVYVYFQHILYMVDTFTTADFAELGPANDVVRLFSGFMAIVGIFLAGLLGFVAGNRIRRS